MLTAPPRHFAVRTPRARIVDLGCAFTITLDELGRGKLVVSEGAVSMENGATETVPSGETREIGGESVVPPVALPVQPTEHVVPARLHHAKQVPLHDHTAHAPGDETSPVDSTLGPKLGPARRDSFRPQD